MEKVKKLRLFVKTFVVALVFLFVYSLFLEHWAYPWLYSAAQGIFLFLGFDFAHLFLFVFNYLLRWPIVIGPIAIGYLISSNYSRKAGHEYIKIALALIMALAANNLTRNLDSIDNGVLVFFGLSSLAFVLGALMYSGFKQNDSLKTQAYLLILSGCFFIIALSMEGLIIDIKGGTRIVAYYKFADFSPESIILEYILSLINYLLGFGLFFYAIINIVLTISKEVKSNIKIEEN